MSVPTPPTLKLEPSTPAPAHTGASSHRALWIGVAVILVALGVADAFVVARRARYRDETARLRSSMTVLERERADHIVSQEQNKLRLAIALLRRQAKLEPGLHLAVSVDSAAMYLERDGALLREMPVIIGPERRVGVAPDTVRLAAPLGVRRIARVLSDSDEVVLPEWVFRDRGLAPSSEPLAGALGSAALILDGGTVVYSLPTTGPLADSTYVLPGAVRARAEDLRAVAPNLTPGMRIYFY